ncbi:MAG: hypothetical protein WC683_17765 [bacterium]|jgi:hypothetical protein
MSNSTLSLSDQLRARIKAQRTKSTPVPAPASDGHVYRTDETPNQKFHRIYNDPDCWTGTRLS